MSKHTPGPWTAEDVMGDGPLDICGPNAPKLGSPNLIATAMAERDFLPLEEAIANAQLIAAAPELLEMLKKTQAGFVELHGQGIGCPDCPTDEEASEAALCPAVLRADAAIAKAEGR